MALSTYTELKNSVAAWLTRDGDAALIALIPDFIALMEDELNRNLRIRLMEKRVTKDVDTQYVALPEGYLEMRNFQLNTSPITRLTPASPEYIDSIRAGSESGTPLFYCVIRGEIQLAPEPADTFQAEMSYWKSLDPLTEANPTTALLAWSPRVYLYGVMRQAAIYLEDDEKLARYEPQYRAVVKELQIDDERARYSGALLVARPVGMTPV